MRWQSLRARVATSAAGVIFLAAAIAAIGTAWHAWQEEVRSLDESLLRQAHAVIRVVAKSPETGPARLREALETIPDRRHCVVRVWDPGGKLVLNFARLRQAELPPEEQPRRDRPTFETVHLGGDGIRRGYFFLNGYSVETGGDLADIEDTVLDLIPAYLIVLPLLLMLTIGGGFWLAGRALRPIQRLAEEMETVTADRLDRRLPLDTKDDEIRRLAKVLNAMLERLELSFGQTRRFSTDASHELRTPLTILRAQLESALYSASAPADLRQTLSLSLEEVDRLTRIINGLLLLSRTDSNQFQFEKLPMDFSAFVTGLLDDLELLASGNELDVHAHIEPNLWIEGNESYLRQVLLNLFDNACKYNHLRGVVRLSLDRREDEALLTISNTGSQISPSQADLLFDRFYRGNAAHGREIDGFGLGLPIAREIAKAHGATLSFVSSDEEWTSFELALPCIDKNESAASSPIASEL